MNKILILTLLLILIPITYADETYLGMHCSDAPIGSIINEEKCRVETEYILKTEILKQQNSIIMNTSRSLTENFQVDDIYFDKAKNKAQTYVLIIANLFLVLILTYIGYLWMISGSTPSKKNYAKSLLKNFFIMLIFLNVAPFLFSTIFDISNQVTSYIQVSTNETNNFFEMEPWMDITDQYAGSLNVTNTFLKYNSIQSQSNILYPSGWAYIGSMHAKNIIILTLMILSPFIIMLLLFNPTRSYGKLFLIIFVVEIFMPLIMVLVFNISGWLFVTDAHELNFAIIIAAFATNTFLHLLILMGAIIKSGISIISGDDD